MIIQLVKFTVKPGQRDIFIEALKINRTGTLKEPGNIRFDVLSDPEDENAISIYEVFRDTAALDAHRLTTHYETCMALIRPIIAGDIEKTLFSPVLI